MFRDDDQKIRGGRGMQEEIQQDQKNYVEQIPEVFFIGQIVGGCDFEYTEGLFCEMLPDCGEFWELVQPTGKKQILTQSSYQGNQHMFVWSHPIDLHFTTSDLNGWPRCIFKVWVLDSSNKMDICSYGICNLPKTPGFHQIYVDTWSPVGDWKMGNQQFFLGNQPQIPNQLYNENTIPYELLINGQNRSKLLGRSNGKILIEIECMMRNLVCFNETNQEPQEHDELNNDMK